MVCHIVFGLFFALSIVCTVGGVALWAQSRLKRRTASERPVAPVAVPAAAIQ
jgi:hypothetical protein